jgi:hypothetical protein
LNIDVQASTNNAETSCASIKVTENPEPSHAGAILEQPERTNIKCINTVTNIPDIMTDALVLS